MAVPKAFIESVLEDLGLFLSDIKTVPAHVADDGRPLVSSVIALFGDTFFASTDLGHH